MQDTVHWILQAQATNMILYDCIPVILFLYSERIQHRSTTMCEISSCAKSVLGGFISSVSIRRIKDTQVRFGGPLFARAPSGGGL